MQVRTPMELAALVRGRRGELGWTQAELAQRSGVSPRWIVALEGGKASAHMDMVLGVLATLGFALDVEVRPDEAGAKLDAFLEQLASES